MRRSNVHALLTATLRRRVPMLMATAAGMLVAVPAQAASLQLVASGWASGVPSYISMYEYVPAKLAANPPILVVSHFCGGSASAVFGEAQGGGLVSAADQYGFVMIFPQTSNNCWDVGSTASLTHNGGGDTQAIAEMVTYAVSKHNADANRVYAVGTSSGAMMTEALLAVYPDVFKAGAEFAGVPAGCWAAGHNNSGNPDQWSGQCANGQVTHTAQQWGDMVRAMYPGYSGHRPRVQLWHGTADATINYNNQTEAIKEWTNVLGLSTNPTSTTSVTLNSHAWTRQSWQNSCGFTVLDAWAEQNGPHGTDANLNATYVIPFLRLDKTGQDTGASECPDGGTSGASSSSGGSSGSSGASSSSGGSSGSSGASSSSGGSSGSSGASSSGGSSGSSGASSSGGSDGSGTSSGGSTADGGSAFGGGSRSPGCACRMGPAEELSGGMLLAPIGAVLGIVLCRRRRPRAA